ncbi:lipase family protein [Myroides sp. M-43]|uniref:lipase family protein n=1 Tax=Myroides oncorhynchi TaxID=2893756 RepID=UPI001E3BF17D|nr:lipase family protein [Myroides oncorhynchi]MCC9043801.1 lipase family protein [Myroides oncorhynchi]
MIKRIFLLLLCSNAIGYAQSTLKPIADKTEIYNSLQLASDIQKAYPVDSLYSLTHYKSLYKSPEVGLTNMWGLYLNDKNNVYEIVIRGSVNKGVSWLANYYAAMIPSSGEIQLDNQTKRKYNLSPDTRASVHAGWTIASLYLMEDIQPKLDSLIKLNKKEFIISGHSQGAAIAYLITANLINQQINGKIPADIQFKTYAIAPPKPGNLYFSYQYEKLANNWSYSVINIQDWVPELPPTTQTFRDFNEISPLADHQVKKALNKVPWPKRIFAKNILNSIKNPTEKSVKKYNKYLGSFVFEFIQKQLPELKEPIYSLNSNYARCSNPIILDGLHDKKYQEQFHKPENIMTHHLPPAYLYLLEKNK